MLSTCPVPVGVDLANRAEAVCQLSLLFLPPFHTVVFRKKSLHVTHPLGLAVSHKVFKILLHRTFVFSPPFTYAFSHLFYISMDPWVFILYFRLQSSTILLVFLLKLLQLWTLGTFSISSCVHLTYLIMVLDLHEHFQQTLRFALYISCLGPKISHFSEEPRFLFMGEWP